METSNCEMCYTSCPTRSNNSGKWPDIGTNQTLHCSKSASITDTHLTCTLSRCADMRWWMSLQCVLRMQHDKTKANIHLRRERQVTRCDTNTNFRNHLSYHCNHGNTHRIGCPAFPAERPQISRNVGRLSFQTAGSRFKSMLWVEEGPISFTIHHWEKSRACAQ